MLRSRHDHKPFIKVILQSLKIKNSFQTVLNLKTYFSFKLMSFVTPMCMIAGVSAVAHSYMMDNKEWLIELATEV